MAISIGRMANYSFCILYFGMCVGVRSAMSSGIASLLHPPLLEESSDVIGPRGRRNYLWCSTEWIFRAMIWQIAQCVVENIACVIFFRFRSNDYR